MARLTRTKSALLATHVDPGLTDPRGTLGS
jgi:hypothetical protein